MGQQGRQDEKIMLAWMLGVVVVLVAYHWRQLMQWLCEAIGHHAGFH
jgi:hypothetical protein